MSLFRFLSLCLLLSGAFSLRAQTAALEIISDPTIKEPFFLLVNGVRQNQSPTENILVKGLPYEAYGIELELISNTEDVKKVVFLRIGKTTNYVLSPAGGALKLTEGQGKEKPFNKVPLVVNYKLVVDSSAEITEAVAEKFADFAAPPINFDDEPEEAVTNVTPAKQAQVLPVKTDKVVLKKDADNMFKTMRENMDREAADLPCTGAVTSESVKILRATMREQKSLRDRYNTALKGIANQCITTGQLKDLMRLLDGDELKIEFYRETYTSISDIARRSDLFDLFFFENSINEIQNLR